MHHYTSLSGQNWAKITFINLFTSHWKALIVVNTKLNLIFSELWCMCVLTGNIPGLIYHYNDILGALAAFFTYFCQFLRNIWNFGISTVPQSHIWDTILLELSFWWLFLSLQCIASCFQVFCILISPPKKCWQFLKNLSSNMPQSHIWDQHIRCSISFQESYKKFLISQHVLVSFRLKGSYLHTEWTGCYLINNIK